VSGRGAAFEASLARSQRQWLSSALSSERIFLSFSLCLSPSLSLPPQFPLLCVHNSNHIIIDREEVLLVVQKWGEKNPYKFSPTFSNQHKYPPFAGPTVFFSTDRRSQEERVSWTQSDVCNEAKLLKCTKVARVCLAESSVAPLAFALPPPPPVVWFATGTFCRLF
jgi:hypothetical protein